MTTYPARLVFALNERDGAAVIDAARKLRLPFEIDGPNKQIVVVADDPMQVYQLGARTAESLQTIRRRSERRKRRKT